MTSFLLYLDLLFNLTDVLFEFHPHYDVINDFGDAISEILEEFVVPASLSLQLVLCMIVF